MSNEDNTNSTQARVMKTTSRQISKSRKRGYITNDDGIRVKYTAPIAVHISTKPTGIIKNNNKSPKRWGKK